MADVFRLALILVLLFCSINIRKKKFITSNGININVEHYKSSQNETFIDSALLRELKSLKIRSTQKCCLLLLLLVCGDIERHPGPVQGLFQQRGINIIHQNIRGLHANFTSLQAFFQTNKSINVLNKNKNKNVFSPQESYTI